MPDRPTLPFVLFGFVVFMLAPPIAAVSLGIHADLPKEERGRLALYAAIASGPLVVGAILAAASFQRLPWWSFGLHRAGLSHAILEGFRVCVEWMPIVLCTNGIVRILIPKQDGQTHVLEELLLDNPSREIVFLAVAAAAVQAPIVEELVFRGLFQTWFNRFTAWPAIWCAAMIFAFVHSSAWPDPIPLVLVGIMLGLAYQRTRNLLAPIVAHSLFNSTMIVVALSGLVKPA